jgi:hypothetical protein
LASRASCIHVELLANTRVKASTSGWPVARGDGTSVDTCNLPLRAARAATAPSDPARSFGTLERRFFLSGQNRDGVSGATVSFQAPSGRSARSTPSLRAAGLEACGVSDEDEKACVGLGESVRESALPNMVSRSNYGNVTASARWSRWPSRTSASKRMVRTSRGRLPSTPFAARAFSVFATGR